MGRVFFPTYRSNQLGVRDVTPQSQLRGLGESIVIPRAPAEPYPRVAQNPTGPMLGAIVTMPHSTMIPALPNGSAPRPVGPIYWNPTISHPAPAQNAPPSVLALPGTATSPAPMAPAPPVSAQSSPTPVVTIPVLPQSAPPIITSGGGTAAPFTAPAVGIVYGTDAYGNVINAATGAIVYSASNAAALGVSAATMNSTAAAAASGSTAPGSTVNVTTGTDFMSQVSSWLSGSTMIGTYSLPNALLAAAVALGVAYLYSGGTGKRR